MPVLRPARRLSEFLPAGSPDSVRCGSRGQNGRSGRWFQRERRAPGIADTKKYLFFPYCVKEKGCRSRYVLQVSMAPGRCNRNPRYSDSRSGFPLDASQTSGKDRPATAAAGACAGAFRSEVPASLRQLKPSARHRTQNNIPRRKTCKPNGHRVNVHFYYHAQPVETGQLRCRMYESIGPKFGVRMADAHEFVGVNRRTTASEVVKS